MTDHSEITNRDSLVPDFASQLRGEDVFVEEPPLDLAAFLDERGVQLSANDPRLESLLELQIAHRVRAGKVHPDQILVNEAIASFADLPSTVIQELAIHEWQLRRDTGEWLDVSRFAAGVIALDAAHQKKLGEELHRLAGPVDANRKPQPVNPGSQKPPYQFSPGEKVGPCEIISQIGRGGMGEVYRARQLSPVRRDVALKIVLSTGLSRAQFRQRFEGEQQALAMMDHPNIAKVYDGGVTSDGLRFLLMEYVNGKPIAQQCDAVCASVNQRLQLFVQICRAIQHAHQKGIIHRDITPGNVLVTESDGRLTAHVIDFGLAKALVPEARLTEDSMYSQEGRAVGTIHFMSPEQTGLPGLDIDVRTDIYSLGSVMYYLLTGQKLIADPTFSEKDDLEKLMLIRHYEPLTPSARLMQLGSQKTANAGQDGNALSGGKDEMTRIAELRQTNPGRLYRLLRGELDWIVMKALEKDRERRYQSASELADDVERFLTQRPVKARPPSLLYRLIKALRRHKAITIVMTALVIGGGISTDQVMARWKAEENFKTEQQRHRQELADAELATAKESQRSSERQSLLQRLLVTPIGTGFDITRLEALDAAMRSDLLTEIDRTDLQLAKATQLYRMQSYVPLQQLIAEIEPITDRQRGQVELWKIRQAALVEQQRGLAARLLEKQADYQLDTPDIGYLQSLLAPTRPDAIRQLYRIVDDFPQHEFTRKFLVALLLIEGRSQELDHQIELAQLLFPGSIDIELAEALALAFRGDQNSVEEYLKRLEARDLFSADDKNFQGLLLSQLTHMANVIMTLELDMSTDIPRVSEVDLLRSWDLLQKLDNQSVLRESISQFFGAAIGIGTPEQPAQSVNDLLPRLLIRSATAKAAQRLGIRGPTDSLIADIERASPFPGDAFFSRMRALQYVGSLDFHNAAKELDAAIAGPCVFPRLRYPILHEAAMSHMGIYFKTGKVDESELRKARDLAQRWVAETDRLPTRQVQEIQGILKLNGEYDAALNLIHRYRESTPESSPVDFQLEELQILLAMKRYPEVIEIADRVLASNETIHPDLLTGIQSVRNEAAMALSELLASIDDSEEPSDIE